MKSFDSKAVLVLGERTPAHCDNNKLIMKLVQTGFLCLTLFALAGGFLSPAPGGLGGGFAGISGIFGLIILLVFLAALSKANQCPVNYQHIPNNPSPCIRFFNTAKNFNDAKASCTSDGGKLLTLDPGTFGLIRQLAATNTGTGTCNFWVDATEAADGTFTASNGDPIPNTIGLFFQDPTNAVANECGLMNNADNFLLIGSDCTDAQCYICQK